MVAVKMFWEVDMETGFNIQDVFEEGKEISKIGSWESQAVKQAQKTVSIAATGYSAAKMSHQSCPALG